MFSILCVTTAWPKFGLPVITAFLNYTGPVAGFRTGRELFDENLERFL